MASTKKQETHERIVRTAATAIREHGYDGVSVADIMAQAGLTHGGFYAHFPSRDAMLAEALDSASGESIERLGKAASLEALLGGYLSDRHVEDPGHGCSIAALGSETARQPPEVRQVATRRAKELADVIARQLPTWGKAAAHEQALGILSAMVGALLIARISDDPAFGKAVRAAATKLATR